MAFRRQTLISISVLFFSALYAEATNSSSSPTPTPTPTPSPSPSPSPGPASGSPTSLSHLFERALPTIGVQKAEVAQNEGVKVVATKLQGIEPRINEFKGILKKRLADPKTPKQTQTCFTQCEENFDDAIDDVQTSIEAIDMQNLYKANMAVSALATDVDTCNECFVEMGGEDKEIKAFNDWVQGVTGECLPILQAT